ncbi:hypothetical protein C3B51_13180 [Pseudoalteromonas rubra]|uniref:Tail specific protease domain-containing protein n=1 Tax=Pseudoalteromonas rubra TaxID=43658 RepID=A0A4Q7EB02_9GAMM|nr:S41 family peptidase [Pseudoalteromonas rubra]RZM80123.1 hypothetical protein C3B51_13180 [Pseudoalteromonas rubra]
MNLKHLTTAAAVLMVGLIGTPSYANAITQGEKAAAIEKITQLMSEHYVFPEVAAQTNRKLHKAFQAGHFASMQDHASFSKALTEWLRATAKDGHLRVRANPVGEQITGIESSIRDNLLKPTRHKFLNYGVLSATVLENNIGYIDLRAFYRLADSKPYIDAAMKMMAKTDAVIIDLRKNGGGSPRTVQYLCSYFFDEKFLLNSLYFREGNETTDYYVLDKVGGEKMPDVPLYVLTSTKTYSAAEEFSYNMLTRKRATLVGETTGGAANPGGMFTINDELRMFIATGTAINPVTQSNWETVGVKPTVEIGADDALDKAIEMANEVVEKNWLAEQSRREIEIDRLLALLQKVRLSDKPIADIKSAYAGKVSELAKSLPEPDRVIAELAYEYWDKESKYAVFLFDVAVRLNNQNMYFFAYWARALARLDNMPQAISVLKQGLKLAADKEDKQMLLSTLAELEKSAVKL